MKGNQLWGYRKVRDSSPRAFSSCQAKGILTQSFLLEHTVWRKSLPGHVYMHLAHTLGDHQRRSEARQSVWEAARFGFLLVTCAPIRASYDWKVTLNQNTGPMGKGQVVTQTAPKRRDHKPNKQMNMCMLFKIPNLHRERERKRERKGRRLTHLFIYYTSQAHLFVSCLG